MFILQDENSMNHLRKYLLRNVGFTNKMLLQKNKSRWLLYIRKDKTEKNLSEIWLIDWLIFFVDIFITWVYLTDLK